jgi:hypothetical protein
MGEISFRYEVFIIPYNDDFILYIPLKGMIFIIDEKRKGEIDKICSGEAHYEDIIYSPFLGLLKELKLFGQLESSSLDLIS